MTTPLTSTLLRATREYGTPLYAYDSRIIEKQYLKLKNSLGRIPHEICFAVKSNSNLSILNFMTRLGAGFDIVSGGELHRVLKAGGAASRTVFAGVGKTVSDIKFGLFSDIRFFNVESAAELQLIKQIAESEKTTAQVSIRINPNISVNTHPHLTTGLNSSKFGVPREEVPALWESVKDSRAIRFVGIDCHIGSHISELAPLEEAYQSVLETADALKVLGAPIEYIDFGGGLGISYSGHYEPLDVAAYGAMIQRITKNTPYTVIVEPGKFLIAESGMLLTEVLYTKTNGSKKFAITSAGMNDLIRPSLYDAYHKIEVLGRESEAATEVIDVVGPVCESGCFFAHDRKMPPVNAGDILVIKDAGAYGFSMASNYNSRPLPAEILITSDDEYKLIRKRDVIEDLYRNETFGA